MDNSLIDFAIGPVVAEALQRCGLTDTARRNPPCGDGRRRSCRGNNAERKLFDKATGVGDRGSIEHVDGIAQRKLRAPPQAPDLLAWQLS
jgi:hypothetical protein